MRQTLRLLLGASVSHGIISVAWPWKPVSEIEEVFWDTDCAQQYLLYRLVFNLVIIEVVLEELLSHPDHSRHI